MGFGGTDLGRVLDARPLSSEFESWVGRTRPIPSVSPCGLISDVSRLSEEIILC